MNATQTACHGQASMAQHALQTSIRTTARHLACPTKVQLFATWDAQQKSYCSPLGMLNRRVTVRHLACPTEEPNLPFKNCADMACSCSPTSPQAFTSADRLPNHSSV